ncbi:MAG: hypothetical protein FJ128_07170 [Deltaproteobacteria bacterium]|nr:hypothetical protein [Deltaproteobacteria bacterium]
MSEKLRLVTRDTPPEESAVLSSEEKLRLFRKVAGSLLQDAQGTWADIWQELMGTVTNGVVILPDASQGPKCGWAEFLEKLWLLKHYLDYTKRFVEGKA